MVAHERFEFVRWHAVLLHKPRPVGFTCHQLHQNTSFVVGLVKRVHATRRCRVGGRRVVRTLLLLGLLWLLLLMLLLRLLLMLRMWLIGVQLLCGGRNRFGCGSRWHRCVHSKRGISRRGWSTMRGFESV